MIRGAEAVTYVYVVADWWQGRWVWADANGEETTHQTKAARYATPEEARAAQRGRWLLGYVMPARAA